MARSLRNKQAGFTLLELLLATGLLAGVMLATIKLTNEWTEQERAQVAGQQLQAMADALEEYVQTVQPGASVTPDNVLADPAWASFADSLEQSGVGITTRVGGEFRIAQRTLGTDTQPSYIIYTRDPAKFSLVGKAARAGGGHAGFAGFQNGAFAAQSAYNMWGATPTTNLNTAITTGAPPLVTAPTDTTQGYLVALLRAPTQAQWRGPYLYRQLTDGDPQYNTMQTDLLMSGNDVSGVNELGTDSLVASGSATAGSLTVNGTSTLAGNVSAGADLTVAGNTAISGDATMQDLTATGDIVGENVVGNVVTATNGVTAATVDADNLTITGNLIATSINATGSVTAGQVFANTLEGGTVQTNGSLNAGDVAATNRVTAGSLTVGGNTQINGNVQIDNCLTLAGDNYGGC